VRAAISEFLSCSRRGPASIGGGVDFNVDQPHSVQTNFSVERELPWSMAASIAYTGNRGLNLYRRTDMNPVIPFGTPSTMLQATGSAPTRRPYFESRRAKVLGGRRAAAQSQLVVRELSRS
jgi:hypothetical protein